MFGFGHEERTGEKWSNVIPEEWRIVSESRQGTLSPEELLFYECIEYWRYQAHKYYDALQDVCRCFWAEQNEDVYCDLEYGKAPLKSHGKEALKRVMDILEVKEEYPEYLVWDWSSYDN